MHGQMETAGTAATSIAFGGTTAAEPANSSSSTTHTQPASEALDLAFDMVGAAIGAFLDALS